jgi:L-galactose dehydrogenase
MEYRSLADTSLDVSVLGFGASPLGNEFREIDPADGQQAVNNAIDHGVNYFDVAPYYGRTLAEERLGKFLDGKRDEVILATKACRYGKELPDGFDFSAERTVRSVEESLHRLRTDVIDVLQVHDVEFGDADKIIGETLPALHQLKKQGKIRYVGITGYPLQILKKIASEAEVDTILSYCHYDLMDTTMDRVLTPFAREQGIGLINASPLHMGMLTDRGAPDWHPAPPEVEEVAQEVAECCADYGTNVSALAMQFALDYDGVATTLVGMSSPRSVERNVQALNGGKPDPELLAEVQQIVAPVADRSWPSGLPENQDDALDASLDASSSAPAAQRAT